jgi:putative ABC transport system permease protein
MQLHDIAIQSVKRRKGRFAFVLTAIASGVGAIVALVALTQTMAREVGDELDRFGANIVVTAKSDVYDLSYGAVTLGGLTVAGEPLTREDADAIRTIPHRRNISLVSPKLVGVISIADTPVVLIGTILSQEPGLKPWWRITGAVPHSSSEVLLGADVAIALGATVGSDLVVGGGGRRVAGILAPTGSIDDRAVFVDLDVAQRALGRPGAVALIEVSALCRGCPIDEIVSQIRAVIPHAKVTPIRQAVAAREQAVAQLSRFAYAIAALLVLVGLLVVTTTAMASVTERTQEIGILRAVGFRQSHVAAVVLMETVVMAAVGGAIGWLAGVGAAHAFGPAVAQTTSPPGIDPVLGVGAVLAAVLVGVAGGAWPAARAARMDPSMALRQF